ncbi:MAG: DUF6569 family protein [Candidatus Aminicenantaceae bacterium]
MLKRPIMVSVALAVVLLSGPQAASSSGKSQHPVREMVKRLELGKPVSHGNLTIIPIHMDNFQDRTSYTTLEDALKKNWVTMMEVDGGRVPQVKISNTSRYLIFLMGGEILTGCRQDRILAEDVLLAPGTKDLLVPVYCVEHGRWNQTTDHFYSKQNLGTPALRAKAQEELPAAQREIWASIAEQNRKLGVTSASDAFQQAFEKEENRAFIQKVEKKMKDIPRLHPDTVGVVIGVNGEIASVDIFANRGLFAKQWPKILRSSALSSIEQTKEGNLSRDAAVQFLRSLMDRKYRNKTGLDLGFEYSSVDSTANIQALAYEERVVHLAAFPQENERLKVIRDWAEEIYED